MFKNTLPLRRRELLALAGLAFSAAPSVAALPADSRWRQFAVDLQRCYEGQRIALDLEDSNAIFAALTQPVLGVGAASGPNRSVMATEAALLDAGQLTAHALVLLAFPAGEARLSEFSAAMKAVRAGLPKDGSVIFGLCDDPALLSGAIRVSVLTG